MADPATRYRESRDVFDAIALRTNAALARGQFNAMPRFDAAQARIPPRQ